MILVSVTISPHASVYDAESVPPFGRNVNNSSLVNFFSKISVFGPWYSVAVYDWVFVGDETKNSKLSLEFTLTFASGEFTRM